MAKNFDKQLVRCLYLCVICVTLLVCFWYIFETIKDYQRINGEIEDFLRKSIYNSNESSFETTIDGLLDHRLEAIKVLLSQLIHVIVLLFAMIATVLQNNSLSLCFSIVITCALIVNLWTPMFLSDTIPVLAITVCTLSWLYLHINYAKVT